MSIRRYNRGSLDRRKQRILEATCDDWETVTDIAARVKEPNDAITARWLGVLVGEGHVEQEKRQSRHVRREVMHYRRKQNVATA